MPDSNGCDQAKYFRSWNPQIKVLLTSGYSDQSEQAKEASEQGFSFIQKPFSVRLLGEKVRPLLDN